ncbi:MAG: SgcJ/EcaC family oxidoreductase [Rhizomicrobium sp.]
MPAAASDEPSALLGRFMQAWSAADANAIAALFADDADFVSPDGYKACGRAAIAAFYAAAFARGYAGSHGAGEVAAMRPVAHELMLIDGRWCIDGARTESGDARPAQRGLLAALVRRTDGVWRIAALREAAGAADFTAFPPGS